MSQAAVAFMQAFFGELCCGRYQDTRSVDFRDVETSKFGSKATSSKSRYEGPRPQPPRKDTMHEDEESEYGGTSSTIGRSLISGKSLVSSRSRAGTEAFDDDKLAEDLRALALNLERDCQKHPRNAGMMNSVVLGLKNRFIRVDPKQPLEGLPGARVVRSWREGSLAYYESKKEATRTDGRGSPKGTIELMHIVKVKVDRQDPAGKTVVVKYRDKPSDASESTLLLRFGSKVEADRWSYDLWDFIAKVRKGHGVI